MDVAALAIGILALVAAIMIPVLFMRAAKPKIDVLFTNHFSLNLNCRIQNVPVGNRLLKLLGIEREPIDDLSICITIRNAAITPRRFGEDLVYGDLENRFLTFDDIESKHIRLPSSKLRAFTDALIRHDGEAYINDNHNHSQRKLLPGFYLMQLEIYIDGKRIEKTKHFRVNENEPLFEWVQ